jgi:hypothetical protein
MEFDHQRIAVGLLASGPVLLIAAGFATPAGLYQAPDDASRLGIIDGQPTRFLAAQLLWALWLVAPALGFVLLSRHLGSPVASLPTLGALAVVAGAAAGVLFVALQTLDPQRFWLGGEGTWAATAAAWLLVVASAMFAIGLLQAPVWAVAGVVLAGFALVGAGALLVSAPPFWVTAGWTLAALAPAIVLWRGG